ncbi:hypothetical protein COX93_01905 [Candidatus Nomurabacteria bacterium CG_4_10_14_0_2_um_filter_30_12]|uniref:Uncharacterized protein n=3 Tax=Candidatus Nomuraibacteriota TaxID=1752729 RepID=A0A1J4V5H0_9BACT|nr:MAG: hypothetical protein AUJ22_01225 [Candidatus Nomurabacteria bacterium CG1_02_31_12]PIR68929.1 MAG: hypothetical protein COU48_01420 [Candidatus Nomurabacteria bacterium CG10_big_fil_rev_8_21_14_0_10_03_31_7]PIZ87173.1 MAG: hypothetical protein COX93_01905 [Candidatus Nomurabacteria bacterium CG_4_10_14_0_2_um_filter_30_12]
MEEKKWDKTRNEYVGGYKPSGNFGAGTYKKTFTPKRPVKTFRDLDVYQKPIECAVLISKNIVPTLVKLKYAYTERLMDCSLAVPLFVAESHSLRFADFALGVGYLEKAMSTSNKMVVYLEHILGLYGSKIDQNLIEDLIGRYTESRTKMFHLEKSWKRFRTEYGDEKEKKGAGGFKY